MATAPETVLSNVLLLPELKLREVRSRAREVDCESISRSRPCPHCGVLSSSIYDHRLIRLKDVALTLGAPPTKLQVLKRRFSCRPCKRVFSEELPGVRPGRRTTERFRAQVMWACDRFTSLKQVCEDFQISSDFAYRAFYEQLELKRRKDNLYSWPEKIGLDEHGVGRNRITGGPTFVTMIVNHSRRKLMEVAFGKSTHDLIARLSHIPGRENVRIVTLDMADTYRSFARRMFPQAQLVADKFHVLRLLSGVILKERRQIAGSNASRKARRLLLCSSHELGYGERLAIQRYLAQYPRMEALYEFKEALHSLYRTKGYSRARDALDQICIHAALSSEPEIRRLGRTLRNWSKEILNYFDFKITNARVEGFNCKASLVRRRAYGYRNLNNYRLRLLSVCS